MLSLPFRQNHRFQTIWRAHHFELRTGQHLQYQFSNIVVVFHQEDTGFVGRWNRCWFFGESSLGSNNRRSTRASLLSAQPPKIILVEYLYSH